MRMSGMKLHIVTAPGFERFGQLMCDISKGRMPADAVCIYPGKRNQLYRFDTSRGSMVVKCFRAPDIINSFVYGHFRKGKACRSYLNSLHLIRLGVGVPEPIAYAEEIRCGRMFRSYYLCREVKGDTIRFYEMRQDCDDMLEALAREMLRLHLLGVWHKDFSPGNVLVHRCESGCYRFNYVDLNRMRFDIKNHGLQLRNFERINYSEMHTLRLAHAYANLLPVSNFNKIIPNLYEVNSGVDNLHGLYPLLRTDALVRKGDAFISAEACRLFRKFWHSCARKHRFKRIIKSMLRCSKK